MHHWGDLLFHEHGTAEHTHLHGSQCTEEAEKNPCHRKLVHQDYAAGCEHDSHLSSKSVECLLCSVAPLRHEGLKGEPVEDDLYSIDSDDIYHEYQETFPYALHQSNESRGPPFLAKT